MPPTKAAGDESSLIAQIAHALHDVCQPLTALQCRLEIDQMEGEMGEVEDAASRERRVADCLRECERLNGLVLVMRALVHRALAAEQQGHG